MQYLYFNVDFNTVKQLPSDQINYFPKSAIKRVRFPKKPTDKSLFFMQAFNWLMNYQPDPSVDKIPFKLQKTTFNIVNRKDVIFKWFTNLKKLKAHHFQNTSFSDFKL